MDIVALRELVPPGWRPWLGALLLVMLVAALAEGWWLGRRGGYDWRAFVASLADAVGRRVVDGVSVALGVSIAAPVLAWIHSHRLFDITLDTGWALALLFFGEELCYYAYHRAAHRVRWFWATHAVHHSPNQLTLATAVRLGWTGKLTGTALFFAPLVWLGLPPLAVAAMLAFNLSWQFWLHTTLVPRLPGPIEWWFNTPSHHRVHHASNREYLDCNYGGVLIIYDRLFGSFVEERAGVEIRYGLTTPLLTHNPVRIALHEWFALGRDLRDARSWAAAWDALVGPPRARPGVSSCKGLTSPGATTASAGSPSRHR